MNNVYVAQVGHLFKDAEVISFSSHQNLLEYDFIVIDLEILVESIRSSSHQKLERRIEELKEFVFVKNIPVVFISAAIKDFKSASHGVLYSFYDLLGLEVVENVTKGRNIEVSSESLFRELLKQYKDSFHYEVSYSKHPGTVIGKAKSKSYSVGFYTSDFVFLPMFYDDINLNITAFLDDLYQTCAMVRSSAESLHVPEWANSYYLPGEKEERERLEDLEKQVKKLQDAKLESELRLSNFLPLKQLWTASGSTLENAVKQVFIELGFVMLPSEARRDDIIMELHGRVVVVEVKGQSKSAAEKNAAQLEKWVSTYIERHEVTPKGILVVNTFREQPLEDRKEVSFPNQMLSYSKNRGHCLITTLQLCSLLLHCRANPMDKENIIEDLLTTVGVFQRFDTWNEFIKVKEGKPEKKQRAKAEKIAPLNNHII